MLSSLRFTDGVFGDFAFSVKGEATFSAGLLPLTGIGRWLKERGHSNQTRRSTADLRLQHRLRHVKYYFVSFNLLAAQEVVIGQVRLLGTLPHITSQIILDVYARFWSQSGRAISLSFVFLVDNRPNSHVPRKGSRCICHLHVLSLRCAELKISRRTGVLVAGFALAVIAGWFYWNWPRRVDMAAYVPADCLAFVEADDLVELADGIGTSEAWTKLATPLGARSSLLPNRWLIRLARWTGIGSGDAILFARSQFAIVFTGVEESEADATVKIKPLTTLIIETHTTQGRMRSTLEGHVEDFARAHGQSSLVRKQIDGVDLAEWASSDGARHITLAFVGTVVIIGNDEASVLRCVETRWGKRASLMGNQQLEHARAQVDAAGAPLFGFVSKAGVKPILQAWALYLFGSNQNATTIAPIFGSIFSNLIEGFAWVSRFTEGRAEDRCFLELSEGVADKLRGSAVPEDRAPSNEITFVPPDAYSVSIYHFRDVDRFWRDVNATVSSHADVVGAIAARPLLRSLFPPYGITDPDTFVSAVGNRMATIRLEENAPPVLVAGAFDRPSLRKLAQQRLGATAKTETVGDAELMLSSSDNFAASFAEDHFLTGTADAVRRCLQARAQSQSLASVDAYRRSQRIIDSSLPIIALTFTDDRHPAISFVELFSSSERSAFSTNAPSIDQASRSLPYSVSVTMLKENGFEWTSRSAFGVFGSLVIRFAPENAR